MGNVVRGFVHLQPKLLRKAIVNKNVIVLEYFFNIYELAYEFKTIMVNKTMQEFE